MDNVQSHLQKRVATNFSDTTSALINDLEIGYEEMAREQQREAEALAWAEATLADAANQT